MANERAITSPGMTRERRMRGIADAFASSATFEIPQPIVPPHRAPSMSPQQRCCPAWGAT